MVEIKNLSLDYGKEHILDDISLSIAEGECVLFTGKSGSGKSSLINSINGLAGRRLWIKIEKSYLVLYLFYFFLL